MDKMNTMSDPILPSGEAKPPSSAGRGGYRFFSREAERLCHRVRRVFSSLSRLSYLGKEERSDYDYFQCLFGDCIRGIDRKIREGSLVPRDVHSALQACRQAEPLPRVALYIGSFDPFQMTHLATALRYLASPKSEADLLYIIPEGNVDPRKPSRTDYRFRYDLLEAQLQGIFEPFILPVNLGKDVDTIGIVERLIGAFAGGPLRLTHIVGSDSLPLVAKYIHTDLERWGLSCASAGVALDFSVFVARRARYGSQAPFLREIRKAGVRVDVDMHRIGTPSSSDFRDDRAITIAFPTEAMLSRLEILFRYSMNRPWRMQGGSPETVFRWEI